MEAAGQHAIPSMVNALKVGDQRPSLTDSETIQPPSAMVAAIAQQARLLSLEAPRQLEIAHKPAPLPTRTLELTEEEWVAQFSTPRQPKPSRPATPLKQIRAEKHQMALAAEATVAERPAMKVAPTWEPGVIYLDDEP